MKPREGSFCRSENAPPRYISELLCVYSKAWNGSFIHGTSIQIYNDFTYSISLTFHIFNKI